MTSNSETTTAKGFYGYSFDGESYFGHYTTREDALAEAKQHCSGAPVSIRFKYVYTCTGVPIDLAQHANLIADNIFETISDNVEMVDDPFSKTTHEQRVDLEHRLRETLTHWLNEVGVSYYTADDIVEHTINGDEEHAD